MKHQFAPFVDRGKLASLLPSNATAVEIGTHRGLFAEELLLLFDGTLYCVDHWLADYDPTDPASNGNREEDYQATLLRLKRFGRRAVILRTTSELASQQFDDDTLDLVYIDGCHQDASVRQDIDLWWPKVKDGGLFAGHDIVCPGEPDGGWGQIIEPILKEFCTKHERVPFFIPTPGEPWSYYVKK